MRPQLLPCVLSNVVLSTCANSILRAAASATRDRASYLAGAMLLNSVSFGFWYIILQSGEDLASTQITVSSSMIVCSIVVGRVVFQETTSALKMSGAALALTAVVVMFLERGSRAHSQLPRDGASTEGSDTVNAPGTAAVIA